MSLRQALLLLCDVQSGVAHRIRGRGIRATVSASLALVSLSESEVNHSKLCGLL